VRAAAELDFAAFHRDLLARRGSRVDNVVCLPRIPSTNALGRRIAGEYLAEGMPVPTVLVVAYEQTRGRGRRGRRWESPAGLGIYASLVLAVGDREAMATLPLLVAVGLAGAVNRHLAAAGAAPCRLKWPNDLLVGGRKLAGILIEGFGDDEELGAVVGFGLNHGQSEADLAAAVGYAADDGDRAATSLRLEMAPPPPIAALAWDLVDEVRRQLDHVGDAGYAARRYEALSLHRPGDRLRCRTGEETVEGTFLGFDRHGLLRLEVSGGELHLAAGEVATP
jgi:BirA family transcriptional regulator, biotin operon repressor / biotin---[acetyl-CoA-carboxylase] ligase